VGERNQLMKTRRWVVVFMGIAMTAVAAWQLSNQRNTQVEAADHDQQLAQAEGKEKPDIRKLTPVQVFMRAKLEDNSQILEGLMTNDFEKIEKAAEHLTLMSTATEWHVIQGPIYKQHSNEFQRSVEQIKASAKRKNLDAATLAYMHMTMTCVNCHKFVRGTRLAHLEDAADDALVKLNLDPHDRGSY